MKDRTRQSCSILRAALAACFILSLAATTASAQQTDATLTGTVKDRNGGAVVGAEVKARNLETSFTRTAVSGDEGLFTFPGMPVGRYEIHAEKVGFNTYKFPEIRLAIGEAATLNIVMDVAVLDETVTVSEDSAPINTETHELSYLVTERSIRELPLNGRNYTDLALLQPGVIAFPLRDGGSVVAHGLGISVNGQDPRSNVYLIDGTPQNDFTNGPAGSAASTSLGVEAIREFRVEANSYDATFGRSSGGQINAISKSGSNDWHGSLYEFHRNDALDARNFFDGAQKPNFRRNQFGGSIGGPVRRDKQFFFFNLEALRENLGKTVSTVVPSLAARSGAIAPINAAVRPYLEEFPTPNGADLGGGLAVYNFGFDQTLRETFLQGRYDWNVNARNQAFARYTFDDGNQFLPTDYPQFPRSFISRNQFFTAEDRFVQSGRTLHTFRFGFSRTRIGQDVEANTTNQNLLPYIPGRDIIGDIDIGGMPRFGPQSSDDVRQTQNVFGFEYGLAHTRGRHLIKAGGLIERYQDNLFNPTFALGIWTFGSISDFLRNRPQRFLGIPTGGALDRYWRFTLFGGYLQDDFRATRRLTLNAGVRYETATTPVDTQGRDSTLLNLSDRTPTVGQLYENPTRHNLSPRVGFAWDIFGDGKTSLRGGYGLYFNTNNQQHLIITAANPPATPRVVINNPTFAPIFPVAPLNLGVGNSIRPYQFNLDNPYVNVYNLNLQRELWWGTVVTAGYAGSRGVHLLRSGDVNIAVPQILPSGVIFFPANAPRQNTAFSTIEQKTSDGNSWYNAGILEIRKRWSHGFDFQSSYTFSRNLDTTQASTFFSDATNGTTTAFPEFPGMNYNKGPADYNAKHNWVVNFTWAIPFARDLKGWEGALLDGWELTGIGQARSGNPLTVFVARNRSRSLWSPSLAPGIGFDRASIAPGYTYETAVRGGPDQYFDPKAFALPPAGTLGNTGRGAFVGPNFRTFDLAAVKRTRFHSWLGDATNLQLRVEAFNLFNRANFAPPSLIAFTGAADNEQPLTTFGRIRSTVGSSRQIQLGLRLEF
ncbi:MAG: TonB-dependent receptor domain-containing protein [Pyrinomonadaceae bacterium]